MLLSTKIIRSSSPLGLQLSLLRGTIMPLSSGSATNGNDSTSSNFSLGFKLLRTDQQTSDLSLNKGSVTITTYR
ncbi:unnamed protein product, partial [Nesidiocoris tenuis]